jgi:succinate-acetate transporter protein
MAAPMNQTSLSEKALLADPAPLGLAAFAFTTFLLSFKNAGLLPASTVAVVMPLAFAYGGLAQLMTGVFEMKKGNTFGFTAFTSYGSFWLFYAMLVLFAFTGVIDLAVLGTAIGAALVLWGILTLYLWIPATTISLSHNLVFLFLWITFFVLGAGDLMANGTATQIGGYLGIVTAACAAYTSFAIVTNSVVGKGTIPLGPAIPWRKWRKPVPMAEKA